MRQPVLLNGPVNAAIEEFSKRLSRDAIVAGDFNNGAAWNGDRGNPKDHAQTTQLLGRHGLVSAYHQSRDTPEPLPGSDGANAGEAEPTFWSSYDRGRPHHVDYIYARSAWVKAGTVYIGNYDDFASEPQRLSDHAPVILRIDDVPQT